MMEHYFGKIQNNEMIYSEIGIYAEKCITDIHAHFADAEIIISQVMPNHVHLIVEIKPNDANCTGRDVACHVFDTQYVACQIFDNQNMACQISDNQDVACHVSTEDKREKMREIRNKQGRLSVIIGSLKSAITKFANENNIEFGWQSRFHDHIIRSQDELERIYEYIQNNVTTWNNDRFNSQL